MSGCSSIIRLCCANCFMILLFPEGRCGRTANGVHLTVFPFYIPLVNENWGFNDLKTRLGPHNPIFFIANELAHMSSLFCYSHGPRMPLHQRASKAQVSMKVFKRFPLMAWCENLYNIFVSSNCKLKCTLIMMSYHRNLKDQLFI